MVGCGASNQPGTASDYVAQVGPSLCEGNALCEGWQCDGVLRVSWLCCPLSWCTATTGYRLQIADCGLQTHTTDPRGWIRAARVSCWCCFSSLATWKRRREAGKSVLIQIFSTARQWRNVTSVCLWGAKSQTSHIWEDWECFESLPVFHVLSSR